jgi:hypothetical protein
MLVHKKHLCDFILELRNLTTIARPSQSKSATFTFYSIIWLLFKEKKMTAFVPVPNYDVAQLKGSTLILVNKKREREMYQTYLCKKLAHCIDW